ncbi:NOP13 [Candida pseudojiufengensis]|uniref:NOP13 n=1 Tax=Candida pseudojiufengensis TaxID=497109 RepID=UPI002224CF4F|nr:NOP13 [Candida pseudojiufengensis]KAI5967816.1 NOP13 [Candida pseudojiufengensis]
MSKKEDKTKSSKKRKLEDDAEELEIDLSAETPLSKKQKRLIKKGKLEKRPEPKIKTVQEEEEEAKKANEKSEKSKFGVWIGNLSFDTTKEDLIRFIIGKTNLKEDIITRVNIPKKGNQIKGFAYIDVQNEDQVNEIIELSEQHLNGRNLLIKNVTSFEGRPEKDEQKSNSISSLPPSKILFVGNLSFDTSEDNLKEHFQHCGDISRIRMATFQDTGKCKGFAFIDFKNEKSSINAMNSKVAKMLLNRKLRLEYGEDRSKRRPKSHMRDESSESTDSSREVSSYGEDNTYNSISQSHNQNQVPIPHPQPKKIYRERQEKPQQRPKSSVALASAQRASAAIVPSSGKKITFD